MSIPMSCDTCQKLIMLIIVRFAKVWASVYGISFILFLSTLPVLQKQVVIWLSQEKLIYISSCEVLPLNSQSDVNIQYISLLSLLI